MLELMPLKPTLPILVAAALAIPVGAVLWANSVQQARLLLTLFLANTGFVLPWFLPRHHLNFLSLASIGLGGVVEGIILGSIFFRITQAVLLALIVGGVLGAGLAYHDGAFGAIAPTTQPTSPPHNAHRAATRGAPTTQIAGTVAPLLYQARSAVHRVIECIRTANKNLTPAVRSQVYALSLGAALLVLLLALIFPQIASMAGGVWAGSLLIIGGALIWIARLDPALLIHADGLFWPQLVFLAMLILGTLLQCRHIFKLKAAKRKSQEAAQPKAARK